MMKRGVIWAFAASLCFAAGVPAMKSLLAGVPPLLMAALCYLGSGLGLFSLRFFMPGAFAAEIPLSRKDVKWLAASIVSGGIIAPGFLMFGLSLARASDSSVIFASEIVFTALIAGFFSGRNFPEGFTLLLPSSSRPRRFLCKARAGSGRARGFCW